MVASPSYRGVTEMIRREASALFRAVVELLALAVFCMSILMIAFPERIPPLPW